MPCFGCQMKNSSTEHLLCPFGFGFPGWFKHTLVSGYYAWSLLLMFQTSQRKTHSIIKRFTSMSTMMWPSIQDHTWKSAMSRQSYQTQNYSKHRQMCLLIRVDQSLAASRKFSVPDLELNRIGYGMGWIKRVKVLCLENTSKKVVEWIFLYFGLIS